MRWKQAEAKPGRETARRSMTDAGRCHRHAMRVGDARPARPCRCDAARATHERAVANRFGPNQAEAALPAEAHRRPAFPEARVCEPFQSVWLFIAATKILSSACRRQLRDIRSPKRGLAPNSPMCRTDQDRLIRPNVEPDVGLAPAWKAPRRNADLVSFAKLQIAMFRRQLDR